MVASLAGAAGCDGATVGSTGGVELQARPKRKNIMDLGYRMRTQSDASVP